MNNKPFVRNIKVDCYLMQYDPIVLKQIEFEFYDGLCRTLYLRSERDLVRHKKQISINWSYELNYTLKLSRAIATISSIDDTIFKSQTDLLLDVAPYLDAIGFTDYVDSIDDDGNPKLVPSFNALNQFMINKFGPDVNDDVYTKYLLNKYYGLDFIDIGENMNA